MKDHIRLFESQAATPAGKSEKDWKILTGRETPIYEREDDIRGPFARDYTRVLHSLAYRRLKHKTQVFFNAAGNDHICTRIEHVAHVESVANTIAGNLGLNEELTKAIAMAHDLGHAPFGHEGEAIIRRLTGKYLNKNFWHEQNGLYFVEKVELLADNANNMQNLNLTYAVRDGIISHCGELDDNSIRPRTELLDLSSFESAGQYESATWEGCVVKLSDKIAYLGRDIEDAIMLGYLNDTQKNILRDMARTRDEEAINTTVIMHNMIIDLCQNSSPEKGLRLSDEMSRQLNDIKKFNYEYIYGNKRLEPFRRYAALVINEIFDELHSYYCGRDTLALMRSKSSAGDRDVPRRIKFATAFAGWILQYTDGSEGPNRKIYGDLSDEKKYIQACIDYIAGMTDAFASACFNELLEC